MGKKYMIIIFITIFIILAISAFIIYDYYNHNIQQNNINDMNTSEKTDSENISVSSENNTTKYSNINKNNGEKNVNIGKKGLISKNQAIKIVKGKYSNKIKIIFANLEKNDYGKKVWNIGFDEKSGRYSYVSIDAKSGKIVRELHAGGSSPRPSDNGKKLIFVPSKDIGSSKNVEDGGNGSFKITT